jgi:REP element-mobilizing transposase RayT
VNYNPDLHHRRSIRLRDYDYAQAGAYFIALCARYRRYRFGGVDGTDMRMNDAGKMLTEVWNSLPQRFPDTDLDAFVVMPNHVHGIIWLANDTGATTRVAPTSSLGTVAAYTVEFVRGVGT